jgi:hypothetical protein
LTTKRVKDMYEYVYDNHSILDLYVQHLYSRSLTDNLLRFLNLEESYDSVHSIGGPE